MILQVKLKERIQFLSRVVGKESHHLNKTVNRLFANEFSLQRAKTLEDDDDLSEQLEAFTARFVRLQDTLGDKLLPHVLQALNEKQRTHIDNLDVAERLGWLPDVEDWLIMRQLRNQMVHEYIEDLTILVSAVNAAYKFVPILFLFEKNIKAEIQQRGWLY